MGAIVRRKQVIIVPDNYWTSTLSNIKWITKESNAKTGKRNK